MKFANSARLMEYLSAMTGREPVFAEDENGEFYEVTEVSERSGHVVLKLGTFWHSLPNGSADT